jgi:hypothetical protein
MVGIDSVPKLSLQHCLKANFIGLIAHFSGSMSTTVPATTHKAPRANWNNAEITALIDHLVEHIAKMPDGGNFKKVTFIGAFRAVGPHHSAAPKKQHQYASQNINW